MQSKLGVMGLLMAGAIAAAACKSEEPKVPPPRADPSLEEVDPSWNPEPDKQQANATRAEQPRSESGDELAKPEFREGMSVDEAIKAVPSGYDYVGLDQEVLERPLRDPATYEPCKNFQNYRFKVRLAIWNGKVVGMDLTAPPAIKDCVAEQIWKIEYPDKVESINTIDYAN